MELLLVKVQFGSLQDVAIAATSLSRSAGDLGQETTGGELSVQSTLERSVLLSLLQLGLDLGRLSGKVHVFLDDLTSSLLDTDLDAVVGLVPGLEGVGVDEDNGSLDEGLGTDQLVVGGIVGDVENTDLAGADFRSPGEVSSVQSEGPELLVASPAADLVDAGLPDLGHGGWSTHFELSLLSVFGPTTSRLATLVASFT